MLKEIIENFETAMKKGFISSLILLILEKEESCHGYKISKAIEERTLGVWKPPSSTMYTVLNSMKDKGLIECYEQPEGGRTRKVYEITARGKEALKQMLEKVMTMKKTLMSLIASTLDIEESAIPEDFHAGNPFELFISKHHERTVDEKLQILEFHKEMMTIKVKELTENLKNIKESISNLKSNLK